jgi:hypothetical protein
VLASAKQTGTLIPPSLEGIAHRMRKTSARNSCKSRSKGIRYGISHDQSMKYSSTLMHCMIMVTGNKIVMTFSSPILQILVVASYVQYICRNQFVRTQE